MPYRLRAVRVLLTLVTLGAGAYTLFQPGVLVAEDSTPGCEFATPSGDFVCRKPAKHIYLTSCEGVDCYYYLETCCHT